MENENTIHKSFMFLVDKFKEENIQNNYESKSKEIENWFKSEDSFIKIYFCCDDCYNKFIRVIKKIKDENIDLTKIDWNKYSPDSSNIIVKLVTYYYNLGLQNSSSSK